MSEDHKKQLEQQLWNIANTLRGKMNADEFRDYILGFIFYKYLSERMYLYANSILKEDKLDYHNINEDTTVGKEYIEAIREEALSTLGYFLKPSELFSEIAKRGNSNKEGVNNFILEDLAKILSNIEQSTMGTESEDDFDNLFEDLDLASTKLGRTESAKNELISKVLMHLDNIDFQLQSTQLDVLGDAYEYLIGQFASSAGKKAGEFYTPQQVSTILARIVTTGNKKLKSAYDPTCGSGSLLLRVKKEADEVSNLYGQELNRTTYNLARMNMIMHGVHYRSFNIRQEDTLEHPQHLGMIFEAIVANPPFSAQWSANPLFTSDDRFSQYGKLAPSSKADFAFVQHMIYHLAEKGTMAIVLPHGALFRGGAEQHIRKYLIEDCNYLDAVIGLPVAIFYGTTIPTCILVFKKCRENPEDILFVDASKNFEKQKTQNVLRNTDIDKIVSTYRNLTEEVKFSKRVQLTEIAENDYNLNISRYVDTFELEEEIDLDIICNHLKRVNVQSVVNDSKIFSVCSELNIAAPIGYNVQLLNLYKKGVMQKIFTQKLRFKDEDGNNYPKWEKKKLGKICKIYDGTHQTPDYTDDGIPFYSVEHVTANKFSQTKYISEEVFDRENQRVKLEKGDILMTRIGDIGTPKYIDWEVRASFYVSLALIKSSANINNQFICQFIKSDYFQSELHKRTIHVAFPKKINLGEIGECLVSLPCENEQTKIANFLSAIDDKIEACTSQIEKTLIYRRKSIEDLMLR